MKSKGWIIGFFLLIGIPLAVAGTLTAVVDPYFHYHAPKTEKYFYPIGNQRSQNDGIVKNFEYEGLLTGTSMTENFKTSELEAYFGCPFVKVPFSGGSYKEINDNLKVALSHNDKLKIIVRGLDLGMFIQDKDGMRTDLGEYPTYLYNDNPFDDVQYLFSRDVVFTRVYSMLKETCTDGFQPGITSFDAYSNWMAGLPFGRNSVFPDGVPLTDRTVEQVEMTEEDRRLLLGNIRQNVTELAAEYPDVTFYYFFTPYSAAWFQSQINEGTFEKQLQAEKLTIEEILKQPNIKLYSFNNMTEITTDLNHFKDIHHYAEWINSLFLKYMTEDVGRLTTSNYEDYLKKERDFYWSFDYENCFVNQEDYEQDYNAAEILNSEISGSTP